MRIGNNEFEWGSKTYVMGIVNVTSDSFSGDGLQTGKTLSAQDITKAVAQCLRMEDDGADILDIGGESTRPAHLYPGSKPVTATEELNRVIPVIQALKAKVSLPISIDTRKAQVAAVAISEGASMVNDVSMLADKNMASVVSAADIPIVVSHTRPKAEYRDVITDIYQDLEFAIGRGEAAGLKRRSVIADPGIGFAKLAIHSREAIRRLAELKALLKLPLLIGTSRKSFIAKSTHFGTADTEMLEGTAATIALSIAGGVDIVRVHNVKAMAIVSKMSDAIVREPLVKYG